MTKSLKRRDYEAFLAATKARILEARTSAVRAVNRDLVLLYWDIGQGIVEKQMSAGWGEAVVERLAADLREAFPDMRGFSVPNLWRMKQLYLDHTSPEFLAQAVRELAPVPKAGAAGDFLSQAVREMVASVPWGHHANLLTRLTDPAARLYYLRATAKLGWSRNVLLNQIKASAYERARKERKTHNFALALPQHFAEQADEMMKSRYNLEFLGIRRPLQEREMESRLVDRLQRFILELGYGFCFVGRQHRLGIDRKDAVEVEFALKSKTNPIGVAEYRLRPTLPRELRAFFSSPSVGPRPSERPRGKERGRRRIRRIRRVRATQHRGRAAGRSQEGLLKQAHLGRLPTAKQLADAVREVLPNRK